MLTPLLGRNLRSIRLAIGLAVGAQACLGLLPLIQKVILDDTVLTHERSLGRWIAILLVVGSFSYLGNYLRRRVGLQAAARSQRDLQIRVHHQLQHLDATGRARFRTGDVMSRATSDLTIIQMFLQQLGIAYGNLTLLVVGIVVMVVLSPLLALVMVASVPVFFLIALRFRSRSFPASWTDQLYKGALAGVVEEAVTGVRIVKAFGQEAQEQGELDRTARTLFQSRLRTARITAFFGATLQVVPGLTQLAVLGFGGWLAIRGTVSLGVILAFSSYVLQLVTPVRFLSSILATSQQARAGAARIVQLLATQSAVVERPGAVVLENASGKIEFEHVDFAYPGGELVLRDVSLRIEPGERVAVVGTSGSGKSTLAQLLVRFYDPGGGSVQVDGRDVRDYTLDSLRAGVGVVLEEGFLFTGTIRDNIAFGRPGATTAEIEHAAAAAQAHGFISGLPDGYETVVGERGFTLSGGQRQRIALARAALTGPRVLVLDDATSAIDARTERAIHASFDEVLGSRTTVLIAKRLSTLHLADRVVVLDQGRIVEQGTADELLARSDLFRDLFAGGKELVVDVEAAALVDAVDPAAWPEGVDRVGAIKVSSMASTNAARAGAGHGGGGADMSRLAGLVTESAELLAAVDALPPLQGDPGAAPAPRSESFSLRGVFGGFRLALALLLMLVLVDAAASVAIPALIRFGIDHGIARDSGRVLVVVCLILLALQGLAWFNARAMAFRSQSTAERMLFGLRVRTFAHLQRLSLNYYEQHMAGKIMTRMTSDIEAFSQLLQQGLLIAMTSLVGMAGIVVTLALFNHSLALVVSGVLVPLVVSTWWFQRASSRTYLVARERIAVLYADLQESLAGVEISQAYGQQPANERRFAALADAYCRSRCRAAEYQARYFPFLQLLNVVAKAIALAYGAHRVGQGSLDAGVLIAFLLYLDQFFTPIQQLSTVFDQWLQANVASGQLHELLQTRSATPETADPVEPGRVRGEIGLSNVTFAYPSTGLVAMRDVSLSIPAGQVVALVGTTGAGKSTLVKLVARFYDATAGTVSIDGVPLRDLDLAAYRRRLGFVPQEPFLFSGTIRSNIAYGRPDATDLEVERAARAVGAHEFVVGLPQGYLTPVSEQGRSLSAGQRQLLSLARALLVDPAILLLDEATANLDLATEARVQRAIGLVSSGRTTLLIAHRLHTARAAHRILVVDDGVIVEDGPHDELLALDGRYAELWAAAIAQQPARPVPRTPAAPVLSGTEWR